MRGMRSQMQWLSSFKSALVAEDEEKLESLAREMPADMQIEQIQEAMALLSEALSLFCRRQIELKSELEKAEKAKHYSF